MAKKYWACIITVSSNVLIGLVLDKDSVPAAALIPPGRLSPQELGYLGLTQ